MSLPRRTFLLGSVASGLSAVGVMTASCGRLGMPGGSSSPKGGYLPPEKVESALRDLVKQAGRETFQSVSVDAYTVEHVGRIHVSASPESGDDVGLKPDASGRLPHLDPDDVAGVRAAVAEIVAAYGREAERIGSFNGFVHVDGNVAGCRAGVRIVRRPSPAATAMIEQGKPFHRGLLFDPGRFDPATAVAREATIAREAHVKGRVWDWEYRRPSTRVWLNEHGKIAKIDKGHCEKTPGWCPG